MPDESLKDAALIQDDLELDSDAHLFYEEDRNSLNKEQEETFNSTTYNISNGDGGLHRIDAPGGSENTFWLILFFVGCAWEATLQFQQQCRG